LTCEKTFKELRKSVAAKEARDRDAAEMADDFKLVPGVGKAPTLVDVQMKPVLSGRKAIGYLKAYGNGFRFTTQRGETVDFAYDNVRHAFFQSSENDIKVIIHFSFRRPIMLGKKKVYDLQFFTEVMEESMSVNTTRIDGYDRDEIEQEQREREKRNKLNNLFASFVRKVEDYLPKFEDGDPVFEFDIPYRAIGFEGVTERKTALQMYPTTNCLIELTDFPFFVLDVNDVDIAVLERVDFGAKNFDIVFVKKNFKNPAVDVKNCIVNVSTVPNENMDAVKEWLSNAQIRVFEMRSPLAWKEIISHIRAHLDDFEADGWEPVLGEDEDEEEEEDEEDEDATFTADDEEEEEDEEEYMDDDDEEESDFAPDEEEEEGMDWDEMEDQAAKDDAERDFSDEETDRKKRKRR